MPVVGYVEAGVIADASRNPTISRQLGELIPIAGIEVQLVTLERGRLARRIGVTVSDGAHISAEWQDFRARPRANQWPLPKAKGLSREQR